MFSRAYKKKGVIPLSTYMKIYKRGDIVDIKVKILPYRWILLQELMFYIKFLFDSILVDTKISFHGKCIVLCALFIKNIQKEHSLQVIIFLRDLKVYLPFVYKMIKI